MELTWPYCSLLKAALLVYSSHTAAAAAAATAALVSDQHHMSTVSNYWLLTRDRVTNSKNKTWHGLGSVARHYGSHTAVPEGLQAAPFHECHIPRKIAVSVLEGLSLTHDSKRVDVDSSAAVAVAQQLQVRQ
jgi:hypothetical protein